jgi:hypothetical protein
MYRTSRFLAVVAALGFVAAGVIRFDAVSAQQTQPKPATPTPAATPPIEEDDTVVKVDTELVNVLFTAHT